MLLQTALYHNRCHHVTDHPSILLRSCLEYKDSNYTFGSSRTTALEQRPNNAHVSHAGTRTRDARVMGWAGHLEAGRLPERRRLLRPTATGVTGMPLNRLADARSD